ncbi:MAG TPA: DinB family protein [Anseongella sp.]|nr:DinB family protein [Anseongella sp.]
MKEEELYRELDGTFKELLQVISSFDQEQIDQLPFEDSWTAGQIAEHLILANSGFADLVNGPVEETERQPGEMVEGIRTGLQDDDAKAKSPESVVPRHTVHQKAELLSALEEIRAKILEAAGTLDLSRTCLAFPIPVLGLLTRLEALCFVLYHTQRHVRQLKNVRRRVGGIVC